MEVRGQLHTPAASNQKKSLSTHWLEGWVSLRACLDVVESKVPAHAGNETPDIQPTA